MEPLVVSPWEMIEIQKQATELAICLVFKEDDIHGVWARAEGRFVKFMVDNFGCVPYHSYRLIVDYKKSSSSVL